MFRNIKNQSSSACGHRWRRIASKTTGCERRLGGLHRLFFTEPASLTSELQLKSGHWLSLCHASDELARGACIELDQILQTAGDNTIVTCDDIIHHQTWSDEDGYEQRQYRSPISAIRLYTRAAIGGLVTLPIALFNQAVLRKSYSCLESLRLDCLLQLFQQDCDVRHCHRPLIKTLQSRNPVLPEQGWPKERNPFNHEQLNDIDQIRQRNAEQQLGTGTSVRLNPNQPGCHDLVLDKLKAFHFDSDSIP